MNAARAIARLGLQEALRRRVFLIVALLTVAYLILYGLGTWQAFESTQGESVQFRGVEADVVAGATLLGLNMFGTLFLGTILAVFLTLGAVRGDAERGLLQPLLVRPVPRRTLLAARFASAALVCGAYVIVVFLIATVITWALGGWWPDRVLEPAIGLAGAVAILCALSLAGSVFLASTANGIAVFMVFGAGLVAGLLGQIGEALGSDTLSNVATTASWILPVRGALPVGARRPHRRHRRLHAARDRPRPLRRGRGLRAAAVAVGDRLPGGRRRARPAGLRAPRPLEAGCRSAAARPRRRSPPAPSEGCSTPSAVASSPDSYISVTMSQPPTSSPLTNSWGMVGQLEIEDSSWRMRGSGRMSTAAYSAPSDSRAADGARGEPAHGLLGRALHEEDDLVVSDRVLDGVADGVLGHVHSALVSRERAWMGPPMSAPNTA